MTKPSIVQSYLPESALLEGKQHAGARICKEDCAVIDLFHQYTILASRGEGLLTGTDFRQAVRLSKSAERALTKALQTKKHLILDVDQKPLILFADWLPETGLLLAIRPNCTYSAISEALSVLERSDFIFLSRISSQKPSSEECRTAFEILSDILFHLSFILPSDTFHTADRLIAHVAAFAGCQIDSETALAFSRNGLDPQAAKQAIPLLLCTFLYLRGQNGTLKAEESTDDTALLCRVSVCKPDHTSPYEAPTFASATGLRGFEVERHQNTVTLTFSLPHGKRSLFAGMLGKSEQITLRIECLGIAS